MRRAGTATIIIGGPDGVRCRVGLAIVGGGLPFVIDCIVDSRLLHVDLAGDMATW